MDRKKKVEKRITRRRRIRAKVFGTKDRPRLSIFRSNKHIRTQLIDDKNGETILSADDIGFDKKEKFTKTQVAFEVGNKLAQDAKKKKIKEVFFDKGGYAYHGRVKSVAEGARKGGLLF